MRRTRIGFVVGLAVVVLALVGCGGDDEDAARTTETTETETTTATTPADESTLSASVGPGFEISLAGADGAERPTSTTSTSRAGASPSRPTGAERGRTRGSSRSPRARTPSYATRTPGR